MTWTAPESPPTAEDPKDRILDAAEQLFVERGIGATSLRAITQAAGMNPAAIHYHYGSKDSLLLAVAHRRADPINRQRMAAFDQLEARAGGEPIRLEDLLEAFLRPDLIDNTAPLTAILFQEPDDRVAELVPKLFGEVHERFLGLLTSALPELDAREREFRLRLVVGSMLHVIRGFADIPMPGGSLPASGVHHEQRLRFLIAFAAAGLRAPTLRAAPDPG